MQSKDSRIVPSEVFSTGKTPKVSGGRKEAARAGGRNPENHGGSFA